MTVLRSHHQVVALSDEELRVLKSLSEQQDISRPGIMRMALRYYQLLREHPDVMLELSRVASLALGGKLPPGDRT